MALVKARTFLRRAGVSRRFINWRRRKGYELALTGAMQGVIAGGAVVWDVGANIGTYSLLFADWAGPHGQVYSFEPAKANIERLRAAVSHRDNIKILPLGLSNRTRTAGFYEDEHPCGATFMVAQSAENANSLVQLTTGDALVEEGTCRVPNVVKIDIEGHELEALEGMGKTLGLPECQYVFVEIHFFLHSRQQRDWVPRKIEDMLERNGFVVHWVDQSHINAVKKPLADFAQLS
jgi:FkbM family methyltransferase